MKKNHSKKRIPPQLQTIKCLSIVLAILSLSQVQHIHAQPSGVIKFDIPAQTLSDSLAELADRAGLRLLYPAEWVGDKQAKAVAGEYTPRQALETLLRDSGLIYRFTDEHSVTLERQQEGSLDDIMKLVASDDYRVSGDDEEKPYTGPVEQMDMTVQGMEIGYSVLNASTGTKTDTPILEMPMSVQVVPKAILDDQQAIRLEDALKNVSGVSKGFGFGNLEDTFIIRGFENSTSTWGLTQVYRDGSLAVGGLFSTADVERIEVLKGPAAMLYGRLEPGGLINIVTKRPQVEAAYSIQQQFGSYDTYRTTLGATGALTENGSLTYRLDFEYLDKDTFRDFTFNEQVHVAPKLTWKVSDKTQIDLEYQYFDQETMIDWGIPPIGNRPARVSTSTFLGEPNDRFPYQTNSGSIKLTHAFNDDWEIQAKYYKFSNQYEHTDDAGVNSPVALNEETGELTRRFLHSNHDFNSDFVTLNLNGKFSFWGLDHNLLLGGDWFDSSFTEDGTAFQTVASGGPASINIFNPVYGNGIVYDPSLPINNYVKVGESWFGFYLQDQISLADTWHLLAGFRFDHAEAKSSFTADRSGIKSVANELSPRVGLLYQPLSWLSLYGSYMQGFNGAVGGNTVDGSALGPSRSRQYEAGIKAEWFDGRLNSSLVFYHLTKDNIRTPHTNPNLAQLGFVQQTGEARSQGIEFDIAGQIAENWDVIASYALTDTEITKDRDRDGGDGNQGNRLHNAPLHSGSFWVYHKFGEFAFPELSMGLGTFIVGQREGDLANSFQLPGYVRLDASVKYRKPIGKTNLTVQFNVQNLLDKEYYAAARPARIGVTPGESITFLGSVKLEF